MATVTHKVVKGDTLWALSRKYGTTVDAIAKLNNIKNPNLIYVGQVLTISGAPASTASTSSGGSSSGGSSGSSGGSTSSSSVATITHFGHQSDTDRTIFAVWEWSRSNTKEYTAKWWYDTGDGVWFVGSETNTDEKQSTYSAPQNAKKVKFQVKPISETYEQKSGDSTVQVNYWTASWSTAKIYTFGEPAPSTPTAPTVTIKDYNLTAKVDNYGDGTEMQFQIVQNDSTVYKTGTASIITNSASYSCTINVGVNYKVRCRSKKNGVWSEWSEYSSNSQTKPSVPSGITTCEAVSETSVKVSWNASASATSYTLQYATDKSYFAGSNALTEQTGITGTTYILTGLTSGETYFFRVQAVNEQGESEWTDIKSVVIGTVPTAPTTWNASSTIMLGEMISMCFVHNCQDGSTMTKANIYITVTTGDEWYYDDEYFEGDMLQHLNNAGSTTNFRRTLDSSQYIDGTVLTWKVRTAGATGEYGEWSVVRSITVYAPPSLALNVTNMEGDTTYTVSSFPVIINGQAGPSSQTPISYHVSIVANGSYEYWDEVGRRQVVSKGDEVYSESYDTNQDLLLRLTPDSLDLENNISYTINCVVTMNTGLNAEDTFEFDVAWEDVITPPNAEISYDTETLCAHIRPYCDHYPFIFYKVDYDQSTGSFYRTNTILKDVSGTSVNESYTEEFGDIVYYGTEGAEAGLFFCVVQSDKPELIEGVTLSVYRREYDGRFVEIGSGLVNTENTFVTDPHPALDYARYRIVAISDSTGAVSFTDIPGYLVGEKSVIIQWDEDWDSFEVTEESAQTEKPVWSGSMLKLPFNIDISDSNTMDVNMIEYIGRSHPVSYYGTQLGVTSTWNVEIAKSDKNTLYGLRKLAIYMGDVYVREPSGSGYWAHIEVSFSQTHCEQTIPVTLNVTRVEGGI